MDKPLSPFTQGLKNLQPYQRKSTPIVPAAEEPLNFSGTQKRHNPFLAAMDTDSDAFKAMYGVNRPLEKPMFLGYRDDQPMYGGSKLFILY
jgi:hypothetical protein